MNKYRVGSAILLLVLVGLGFFLKPSQNGDSKFPFKFGLDLVGGTELIYKADVSNLEPEDVGDSLEALRDVIERRINVFGVSEPVVQIERAGIISGNREDRLIVELPGFKNVEEAKEALGETPLLEFRLQKDGLENLNTTDPHLQAVEDFFVSTELTGRFLKRSQVIFDQTTGDPFVSLEFNSEGKEIFAQITKENIGKVLGVFLDGAPISLPIIQSEIRDGNAQITGSFTAQEVKDLVKKLNLGSLPVPIELASTQTVGATLGGAALNSGIVAGIWGFLLVAIFMLLWYRLPGLVAVVALVLYTLISLTVFNIFKITITAAGIAGFILSVGMAVDANILIFERLREELGEGKKLADAMREGFHRAWLSIRDSNVSSIITAIVLFWLGTPAVKGFALTLGVGVLVSMFTAITVSRTLLFALEFKEENKISSFLFGSGFSKVISANKVTE